MKSFITLLLLVAAGYFGYRYWLDKNNPEVIAHPVYAEMRVDVNAGGRELNVVLYGRAVDRQDCEFRSERAWKKVLSACPTCTVQPAKCDTELPARYLKLFDSVAIPSTYLAFDRGSRYERDGRLVVYGLTRDEGLAVCEQMRTAAAENYQGRTSCIAPAE